MNRYILRITAATILAEDDDWRSVAEMIVTAIAAQPETRNLGVTAHVFDDRPGFYILDLSSYSETEPPEEDTENLITQTRELVTRNTGREIAVLPLLYGEDPEEIVKKASARYDAAVGWTLSGDETARAWAAHDRARAGVGHLGAAQIAPIPSQHPDNPNACDWCNAAPAWRYMTAAPVELQATRPTAPHSFGDWYACDDCRPLVDVADWDALARRAGLPVPVPTTVLATWKAFAIKRGDAEPLTTL